jgi:hypothetical protein
MPPTATYFIASKAAIKALTSDKRTDGYSRAVASATDPDWYMFLSASTANADDDLVLMPDDNPTTGRWHKYAGKRGGTSFGGGIICTDNCTIVGGGSGKAFGFYAAITVELIIQPSFDISIQTNNDAIRVYRWSQMPNTARTGQESTPLIQLPGTGGKATVVANSTYRWISVYARNPAKTMRNGLNDLDGTCFTVSGNLVTLLGYS